MIRAHPRCSKTFSLLRTQQAHGTQVSGYVNKMSMITASLWVPRGAAATHPSKYDIDEDEMARISNLAKLQLEDARKDFKESRTGGDNEDEAEDSDLEVEGGVKAAQSKA